MIITESNEVAVTPGRCVAWRCDEPTYADSLACQKHAKEFSTRAGYIPDLTMVAYLTDEERAQFDALSPRGRADLLRDLRERLYMRMKRAKRPGYGHAGYVGKLEPAVSTRRDLILARLREHGQVITTDLAAEFGVTRLTISRDLTMLDREGLCHRVYGGARLDHSNAPGLRSRA